MEKLIEGKIYKKNGKTYVFREGELEEIILPITKENEDNSEEQLKRIDFLQG